MSDETKFTKGGGNFGIPVRMSQYVPEGAVFYVKDGKMIDVMLRASNTLADQENEIAALRTEVSRLKALCPHAQDGACMDWARLAEKRKEEVERLTRENTDLRVIQRAHDVTVGVTKARAEAAERRVGELEGALRDLLRDLSNDEWIAGPEGDSLGRARALLAGKP